MADDAPIRVIQYASDLMFRSRVQAEARAAGLRMAFASSPGQLSEKLATTISLALVDMDVPDASAAIQRVAEQQPDAQIVAYYAHVRDDLRQAAIDAGADEILPRSRFVSRLPELLRDVGA